MQLLEEYLKQTEVHRSTIFRQINAGKLLTTKLNGRTYILDAEHRAKSIGNKDLIKSIKEKLWETVHFGNKDNIAGVINQVEKIISYYQQVGITFKGYERTGLKDYDIAGYSRKSVYRNIGDRKQFRKTRSDKFSIKNKTLNDSWHKVKELLEKFYFKNTIGSIKDVADRIIEYSKSNEKFYEIASIPVETLYKQITNEIKQSGFQTVHNYRNHNNKYRGSLPTQIGAFTDGSFKFMGKLVGDDHKGDVASVYAWDNATKRFEEKQVKIWAWDEMLTGKAWVSCKVGDLTAEDLIRSIIPVILEVGLTSEGVVVDNGIGRADEFQEFINKLYQRKAVHFSPAYQPTAKAMEERAFGLYKSELDAYQNNFVSPHKEDSRHSGPQLSPEATTLFFEDYKKKLDEYITGYYLTRKRTRVINNKRERISIGDYFDRCWQTYNPIMVTPQDIRWALSKSVIKKYNHGIRMNNPELKTNDNYIDQESLPLSYNGNSFFVLYNPYDGSEIDLYALDDMLDRESGVYHEKGSYITTLQSTRLNPERQKTINALRKKINKNVKQLSDSVVALGEIDHPLPDAISINSKILKQREYVREQAKLIIKQKIEMIPVSQQSLTLEVKKVTPEEETISLTYEE